MPDRPSMVGASPGWVDSILTARFSGIPAEESGHLRRKALVGPGSGDDMTPVKARSNQRQTSRPTPGAFRESIGPAAGLHPTAADGRRLNAPYGPARHATAPGRCLSKAAQKP